MHSGVGCPRVVCVINLFMDRNSMLGVKVFQLRGHGICVA